LWEVLLLEPPWQEEAVACAFGWKHLPTKTACDGEQDKLSWLYFKAFFSALNKLNQAFY
jgi:hypothetical protein